MSKTIEFNDQMQKEILKGVETVSKAVISTLGPAGKSVIIEQPYGSPLITRDGVTVARSIELKEKLPNLGASLVKSIATKTDENAGDGTTTTCCLGYSIVSEGLKASSSGVNPINFKNGLDRATEDVIEELKNISKPVQTNEDILNVATISANNDKEIGKIIADAIEAIGTNGVLTTAESKSTETYVEMSEGMEFNKGYLSPYFCTDKENLKVEYNNPYILFYDKTISSTDSILKLLESVAKEGRPLLIMADNVEGEALTTLVVNNLRGVIQTCAVKCPGFGESKKEMLEDIAILTGGTVISEDVGLSLQTSNVHFLGQCESVKITKDSTVIVGGAGDPSEIQSRVDFLQKKISETTSDYEREKIQERLAKIDGGIAILKIGGVDDISVKNKKLIIEDAINATRAAIESGIVPGGGVALCQISDILSKKDISYLNEEEQIGYKTMIKSIDKPIRQISENAGLDGSVIASECKKSERGVGFNVLSKKWVNMYEEGILDPTKVEVNAVRNAASIAGLILTSSCAITIDPEENLDTPNM